MRSGFRIFAVSAMKCTPAKRMTSAVRLLRRLRELERIAEEVGDVLDVAVLVVVREQDRVALVLEAPDLLFEVEGDGALEQRVHLAIHLAPSGKISRPVG